MHLIALETETFELLLSSLKTMYRSLNPNPYTVRILVKGRESAFYESYIAAEVKAYSTHSLKIKALHNQMIQNQTF